MINDESVRKLIFSEVDFSREVDFSPSLVCFHVDKISLLSLGTIAADAQRIINLLYHNHNRI